MDLVLSIRDSLARKRMDERIRRRSASSVMRQGNRDINDVVEEQINHYGQQAYRLGERAYNMTQKRKADGKKIFIATTKHMIGVTYRGLLGTKKTGKKTKRS